MERITALLEAMGNPQSGLRYVHLAGTNGKGSTSLMIARALMEAGYRVGRFISPHLHSYLERLTVNGKEIEPDQFLSYLDMIERLVPFLTARGLSHPTEFEVLTAAAFQYFKDEETDIVVLEVGMGGIYDSTNVIIPEVSVITGVDFDHMAFLGDTLEEIAWNKAGIIKPGIPAVTGEMDEKALGVIQKTCREQQSPLLISSSVNILRQGLENGCQIIDIHSREWSMEKTAFSLLGDYQLKNLATALTALQVLHENCGYEMNKEILVRALADLHMPGRMEMIQENPPVILDAAHNPQGAQALADTLKALFPGKEKIILAGILDDKDLENILEPLLPNCIKFICTRPEGPRGNGWKRIGKYIKNRHADITLVEIENIQDAIDQALQNISEGQYLVITGSFYVLGPARQIFLNS